MAERFPPRLSHSKSERLFVTNKFSLYERLVCPKTSTLSCYNTFYEIHIRLGSEGTHDAVLIARTPMASHSLDVPDLRSPTKLRMGVIYTYIYCTYSMSILNWTMNSTNQEEVHYFFIHSVTNCEPIFGPHKIYMQIKLRTVEK